jgi:hypothetical protein
VLAALGLASFYGPQLSLTPGAPGQFSESLFRTPPLAAVTKLAYELIIFVIYIFTAQVSIYVLGDNNGPCRANNILERIP